MRRTWTVGSPRCCKRHCINKIGTERCRDLRGFFLEGKRDERKDALRSFRRTVNGKQLISIDNVVVCQRFLNKALDLSHTIISNVVERPSANASSVSGCNRGSDSSESRKSGVLAFLRILADEILDEMPNKFERHLPHGNKQAVFLLYQNNEARYGRVPCQASFFYRVWKDLLPHIKCLRSHSFIVCDACVQFKTKLQDMARIPGGNVGEEL